MQAPRRNPVTHPKLISGGLKRGQKARTMTDSEFRRAVTAGHRAFFAIRRRSNSYYCGGSFA